MKICKIEVELSAKSFEVQQTSQREAACCSNLTAGWRKIPQTRENSSENAWQTTTKTAEYIKLHTHIRIHTSKFATCNMPQNVCVYVGECVCML